MSASTLHAQAPHYTLGDLEQRALAAHPALAVAQAESQAIKQAAEQKDQAAVKQLVADLDSDDAAVRMFASFFPFLAR